MSKIASIWPDICHPAPTGYPANRILIKHFFLILKNFRFENPSIIHLVSKIAGIWPDISHHAPTGFPAGNLVSGFQNGQKSGIPFSKWPDIR